MKIWITKFGSKAFKEEKDALAWLKAHRVETTQYRKEHGGKPPEAIKLSKDGLRRYYTYGCSSMSIRLVELN